MFYKVLLRDKMESVAVYFSYSLLLSMFVKDCFDDFSVPVNILVSVMYLEPSFSHLLVVKGLWLV